MEKYRGQPCVVCGTTYGTVGEHIKTKGAGGRDSVNNVMPICQLHHNEKGNKGVRHMAETYESYFYWLIDHGWTYDLFLEKWINQGEMDGIRRSSKSSRGNAREI